MDGGPMIRVAIVDHPGSGADRQDLYAIAKALTIQAQRDFAPATGAPAAHVTFARSPHAGVWTIGLFADPDQPGALGYHDLDPNGHPLAKVFPKLDAQDGANLSTTISHELLEMLADPWLTLAAQTSKGFAAYEACDAVEADEYEIDGVKVSDFVTPAWYEGTGDRFDFLGLCKHALEVRPGGYAQFNTGSGWHQVTHAELAPRAYRQRQGSRVARRGGR
jgi:hypothetical protein